MRAADWGRRERERNAQQLRHFHGPGEQLLERHATGIDQHRRGPASGRARGGASTDCCRDWPANAVSFEDGRRLECDAC